MAMNEVTTTATQGKPIELPTARQGEGTHVYALPPGMGAAAVLEGLSAQIESTIAAVNAFRRGVLLHNFTESASLMLRMAEANLYAAQDGIEAAKRMGSA